MKNPIGPSSQLTRANLNELKKIPAFAKYVDAMSGFLPATDTAVVAVVSVHDEAGVPVVLISPQVSLIELVKGRLEAK